MHICLYIAFTCISIYITKASSLAQVLILSIAGVLHIDLRKTGCSWFTSQSLGSDLST